MLIFGANTTMARREEKTKDDLFPLYVAGDTAEGRMRGDLRIASQGEGVSFAKRRRRFVIAEPDADGDHEELDPCPLFRKNAGSNRQLRGAGLAHAGMQERAGPSTDPAPPSSGSNKRKPPPLMRIPRGERQTRPRKE